MSVSHCINVGIPNSVQKKLIHVMWFVYCFQAAFRGNTLGLPKVCPPENVTKVEKSHILTFLDQYHSLDRIVLAG